MPVMTRVIIAAVVLVIVLSDKAFSAETEWILVSNHNHSHNSNMWSHAPSHTPKAMAWSSEGIGAMSMHARHAGIDVMVLTDHNTILGCHDPAFDTRNPLWICGEEFTAGSAHVGLLFPSIPPLDEEGGDPYHAHSLLEAACRELHVAPCLVGPIWNPGSRVLRHVLDALRKNHILTIINHPVAGVPILRNKHQQPSFAATPRLLGSWSWPYDGFLEAIGLEVGIPVESRRLAASRLWDRQLRQGVQMIGFTGTDYHYRGFFSHPMSRIDHWIMALPVGKEWRTSSRDQQRREVIHGLRSGRALLLRNAKIPTRLEMNVTLGGDVYHSGDSIPVRATSEAILHIVVFDARGGFLHIIGPSLSASVFPLPSVGTSTFSIPLVMDGKGFVRVVISGEKERSGNAWLLSNPIVWREEGF